MIITKELIEKLSYENITKKEHDNILEALSKKTNTIWLHICNVSNRKLEWWAFSNDLSLGHGNGSTGGNFDPVNDKEFIRIDGENHRINDGFYPFDGGFPTEYLWNEDYEGLIDDEIKKAEKQKKEFVEKNENKKEDKEKQKKIKIDAIKQKLTKEELKFVKFK